MMHLLRHIDDMLFFVALTKKISDSKLLLKIDILKYIVAYIMVINYKYTSEIQSERAGTCAATAG